MLKYLILLSFSLSLFSCSKSSSNKAQAPTPNKPAATPPANPPNEDSNDAEPKKHILKVGETRIITTNCQSAYTADITGSVLPVSSDQTSASEISTEKELLLETVKYSDQTLSTKNTVITALAEERVTEQGSLDFTLSSKSENTIYLSSGDQTVEVSSGDESSFFTGLFITEVSSPKKNYIKKITYKKGTIKYNNEDKGPLDTVRMQLFYDDGEYSHARVDKTKNNLTGKETRNTYGKMKISYDKFFYDSVKDESSAQYEVTLLEPYLKNQYIHDKNTLIKETVTSEIENCRIKTQYKKAE